MPLSSNVKDLLTYAIGQVSEALEFIGVVEKSQADAAEALTRLSDVRPYFTPDVAATIYVDSSAGSDATGDGTESAPYASAQHALLQVGVSSSVKPVIQLADGHSEVLPTYLRDNAVTIRGFEAVSATYVVTNAGSPTIAELTVTVSTPGETFEANALRGQRVYQPTQARYGIIVANGATSEGATSITIRQDAIAGVLGPSVGQSVQFIRQGSTFTLTADATFRTNTDLTFESVKFDAPSYVIFFVETEKVNFKWCDMRLLRPHIGYLGNVFWWNTYIRSAGNGGRGVFSMRNGAFCNFFRGTVIDCADAAASSAFVEFDKFSQWVFRGAVELIGLGSNGVRMRRANCAPAETLGANDVWYFRECAAGFDIVAGEQDLPNLLGTVGSVYGVKASGGAYTKLGSTSALATDDGDGTENAVSADGGSTATATAGAGKAETRIEGGDPAPA